MIKLLLDPKVFNYIIMALYVLNIIRWSVELKWGDAAYWFFALGITATVTFGYKH